MDRVSSTTGKIYWIWASLFLFWTSYLSDCLTVSLSLLQKWNWAERASFIFCPRLAMQHRPLPHVRPARTPKGDRCLGRWHGDGCHSTAPSASALRLSQLWLQGWWHEPQGTTSEVSNSCRFRCPWGKLRRDTPNFFHLYPFVPFLAHLCPLMVSHL